MGLSKEYLDQKYPDFYSIQHMYSRRFNVQQWRQFFKVNKFCCSCLKFVGKQSTFHRRYHDVIRRWNECKVICKQMHFQRAVYSNAGMTNIFRFADYIQNFQTFRGPYSDSRSMLKKNIIEREDRTRTEQKTISR